MQMNIPSVLGESQFFSVRCSFDEPQALVAELHRPGSPLIGAVAYFPEKYGVRILPIVLQCLNGRPVPPALYVEQKLILHEGLSLPAPLPACPGVLSEEGLLVAG